MSGGFGFVDELVTGDALKDLLVIKDKPFYEASVPKKRLPTHEEQGWRVQKEGKTKVRIRLDKTQTELLEDDVWSLFAKLGFNELNAKREFKIECGNGSHRKVDVFAKDDEAALIVECTIAEAPGTQKNMLPLIDKIKSYRGEVIKAASAYYGHEEGLKFGWIIVTRNILWSQSNIEAAANAGITVLRDEEIEYFQKLQKLLGLAARFQLLAHVFKDSPVKGLSIKVPATRGKMGGAIFYNFILSPESLLKIAYVAHKRSRGADAIDVYQRMLRPNRLHDIASYIDEGGRFPTNIVVNLQSSKGVRFDLKQNVGDCAFGELYLPNHYGCAWIIDGQHRLYGYALSSRMANSTVPVLAFENLPATDQKRLFIDINHKQVRVSKGLLIDLYSELHWDSDDADDRLTSICSKIIKTLEGTKGSPFYQRVVIGEEGKTALRCLTLTTLASAIEKYGLIGRSVQGNFVAGPLGSSDSNKALKRGVTFFEKFFKKIQESKPQQWDLGDSKGGYVCTNNAIVAFLRVLKEVLDHLEKNGVSVNYLDVDEVLQHVMDYIGALLEWLKTADEAKFASLRAKVGGVGQTAVAREFMEKIHTSKPDFCPAGFKEWLDSLDKQGSKEAKELLDETQRRIHRCVLQNLEKTFGKENDKWWYDGVPEKIRMDCTSRREREKGKLAHWQYFDLIHYKEIALDNWTDLFQKYFAIFDKSGKKENQVSWLVKLNTLRNTVSHPERGLLDKSDVEFIRKVHSAVAETMKDYSGE